VTPSGVRLLLPTPNVSALPLVTAAPVAPMRAGTPAKTLAAILARTYAAVPVWTRGAIPGWIRGEARGWTRAAPLGRTRAAPPGRTPGGVLGRTRGEVLGRTRGEVLGRTRGEVLGRTRDRALNWMRGVVLGWTRVVRLAWRGGRALARDGTRGLVVTPGRTRGVMPGWTRVPLAAPARRVMPRWTRGVTPGPARRVMPGWTRGVIHATPVVPLDWMPAMVLGRPGRAILARGGTQAWAPVAVAIAWTRGVIQGWTRVTVAGLTCAVMPGSIRARTLAGGGVTQAVVPDRRCRVTPGWTRGAIPVVAGGRILGLARAAIPGRGETPGLTRAGRPRGSGRTRVVAVVLARKPGSALVPMPGSGPGRTLSLGRGRGQTGRRVLARILGDWILVPALAPTAHRGRVRDLTPARLSNPLRSAVPGAPARAALTARCPP
jgi:hypothetical protein